MSSAMKTEKQGLTHANIDESWEYELDDFSIK